MSASVFAGTYEYSLDPKSRVTIPSSLRERLGERFTIGLNDNRQAIALYPESEWQRISEQLDRIPSTDRLGRAYVRSVLANSFPEQELDKQGRLLLPQTLRARAGLTQRVLFVGVGSCLELWDADRYAAYELEQEAQLADIDAYVNDRYFAPAVPKGGNTDA